MFFIVHMKYGKVFYLWFDININKQRTKYEQVDDDNKSNLDYIEELERKLKELELALIAINGLNEKYDLKDNTDIHTS
ncbi:hypothetical protein THF1C08_100077 [Vibrio jasicida]|uniref:Uncharacterized protein n=1 Tax=Vibrio jasicida TaxID=766224 RepID=A0AAU9R0I6_9VIBR|nr:hypothetical protein THF1C08_100077 [Vibrio jasicida]CAH1603973.1 hypothetical protein THF1A12_90077 [Vibrio jasicida]